MPILYNFHILLATFYTIFGTNILIECPVPVPVCCMFLFCRTSISNRVQTEIFFGIYVIFGKKNQRETMPEGATRQGARPRGSGVPWTLVATRKAVGALLPPQESQYPDKNHVQISAQSELRISRNLRNGERAESESAETERDREMDPISEGLSPLPRHGGQGPEGKPFSHLGRRSRKEKKKGPLSPSLPVAPEHRQGHHHHRNVHQQLHRRHYQLFPPLCSGVTPLLPTVIST